ncbi:MAG TPA: hypothetical protein VE134_09185 [Methanomicrobiales archaeon]|nr:hypothetical protein [Methanomicrobiales archaeon]
MSDPVYPYKKEGDRYVIEIKLQNVMQLFETLDPSPFFEKDLDRDAEKYITDTVEEFPLAVPLRLVVYLPEREIARAETLDIRAAIHNHFVYRSEGAARELRQKFARGRRTLVIGLAFLLLSLSVNLALSALPETVVTSLVRQGLVIIGWVAMWEPVNIFLYGWWPIRQQEKIYQKIGDMEVVVRPYSETDVLPVLPLQYSQTRSWEVRQ